MGTPKPGGTTARGYGNQHQRTRRRLLANLTPGTPCRRCGQPMWPWQPLDAGHPDWNKATRGGTADALEHAHCNRRAAANTTNRKRRQTAATTQTTRTSRRW